MPSAARQPLPRVHVGIPGLDLITSGGLPRDRLTLVAGTAGSGKTVFAVQFLATGIRDGGDHGVFVTFEERPDGIRRNMKSFGWDIPGLEAEDRWAFVDASPQYAETIFSGNDYDLAPLLNRMTNAVERTGATRVALDSSAPWWPSSTSWPRRDGPCSVSPIRWRRRG